MNPAFMVLDLETCAREDLQDTHWPQWAEKHDKPDDEAALYPEFARISVAGGILLDQDGNELRARGFAAPNPEDEAGLLEELGPRLDTDITIIGHNIKGFDIPFMAKRYLANRMPVPRALRVAGKKPWEIYHVDTMELLKFGGWNSISLESACLLLGVPSPKLHMSGPKVAQALKEGRINEVVQYCLEGDCRATLEIYRILNQLGA